MTDPIIPAATKLAAKRAFVRTTAQAYAALLSVSISATVILAAIRGQVDLTETIVTAAVALISPLIAGLAAYWSVTSKGIPGDYSDATLVKQAALAPDEQYANIDGAVNRTQLRRNR